VLAVGNLLCNVYLFSPSDGRQGGEDERGSGRGSALLLPPDREGLGFFSAVVGINGSHSDAIGMTPFMANYGFEPLAPWAVAPASLDMPDVEARLSMLHEVHSLCRDALQRAKDRMLRYSSRRRREVTYRVGDRVLLVSKNLTYNPDGNTRRKLASVYLGPFVITKATDNTVTVDLPAQLVSAGLHPTFNVSRVRPYYPRPD